jgi:hypothetical protein
MATFGLVLRGTGCLTCETGIPPLAVVAGGVGWMLVAALLWTRNLSVAVTAALLLLSTHLGLMAFAAGRACVFCLGFLAAEVAAILALLATAGRATGTRWWILGIWALCTTAAGFAGSSVGLHLLYPVLPARTLGPESRKLSDPKTTVITVIVHRGCRSCDVANDRMAEALQQGLPLRAMIVDIRSASGQSLFEKHKFTQTPAFIAVRGQELLGTQDGGTVDAFLRTLESRGVW